MKTRNQHLLGLALLATTLMGMQPARADNWMARLSDDAYVMQLSIPGTHDAATGDGFAWGSFADAFGKTQDLSLAKQWAAGVRAFDLRPSVSDDDLIIYHGILATVTRFADALKLIADSLRANPSETAIILMRHEDDNGSNRTTWNQLMTTLFNSDEVRDVAVDFKPRLTLGEVRGKMLLASRDAYDSKPVGAFITGWNHNAAFENQKSGRMRGSNAGTSTTVFIQDYYDLTASGALSTKLNAVTTLLDYSTQLHKRRVLSNIWIINHTSGYTVSASVDGIRECAAATNQAVIDYLADADHAGPTGIVMMDFAGTDRSGDTDVMGKTLVEALIQNNFNYQPITTGLIPTLSDSATPPTARYDTAGRPLPAGNRPRGIVISNGKKHLSHE